MQDEKDYQSIGGIPVDTPHYTTGIPLVFSKILDCLIRIGSSEKDKQVYTTYE
jgi:hypothetical protein